MPEPDRGSSRNRYVIVDDFLPARSAEALATMTADASDWRLHEGSFFSQNDMAFVRREPSGRRTGDLTSDVLSFLKAGKSAMEESFQAIIGGHFTVVGHKMSPGQIVGIHTDSPVGDRGRTENFRLVYYVDREFRDEHGGHLLLFASRDADALLDAVRPNFNSAVLMELSESSFHAVAPIRAGVRHSLVASYWGYPLSPFPASVHGRVSAVIRTLIEKGYEDLGHSGTTFLYHLYNTGEILARLGQEGDVCLAGLCHSLMGRKGVELGAISLGVDELESLVGSRAMSLVRRMSSPVDFRTVPADAAPEVIAQGIVEIANELEQAESEQDLDGLEEGIHGAAVLSEGLRDLMLREVAVSREAIRSH